MTNIDTAALGRLNPTVESDPQHEATAEVQALASISRRTVIEGSKASLAAARSQLRPSWMTTWAFPAYSGLVEIV